MIVYHGSTIEVVHPDTNHSEHNLDFGQGFYVTTVYDQAVRWARRKRDIFRAEHAVVSCYNMQEIPSNMKVCDFGDDMETWIDFVCACRDGENAYQSHDIIKGKVANDKVFRVVDFYRNGIWDKTRALEEIRVYETYDQIAFITQDAIDKLLVFERSEEV